MSTKFTVEEISEYKYRKGYGHGFANVIMSMQNLLKYGVPVDVANRIMVNFLENDLLKWVNDLQSYDHVIEPPQLFINDRREVVIQKYDKDGNSTERVVHFL